MICQIILQHGANQNSKCIKQVNCNLTYIYLILTCKQMRLIALFWAIMKMWLCWWINLFMVCVAGVLVCVCKIITILTKRETGMVKKKASNEAESLNFNDTSTTWCRFLCLTGWRMVPSMIWLGQLSRMIWTSLCRRRDSVKNLASAANGSGVSVPSASRLNVGHWREGKHTLKQ